MQHQGSFRNQSDDSLIAELERACGGERRSLVEVLLLLAEVDRRELYAELGYSSLYAYCTRVLHYSENEAYRRIGVARAGRRFPLLIELIERGELHLTGAAKVAPQLTRDNHRDLLMAVVHKSKRQIEEILAALDPQPDLPDSIEQLANESMHDRIQPLAPDRFAICFSASQRCCDLLEQAKALSSHRSPHADFGELVEAALEVYVEKLEKQKFKKTDRPQPAFAAESESARFIPAQVKREVHQRDAGQCTFVGANGHRCCARSFLEYDHAVLVAHGGRSTTDNLRLRCRRHNQLTAKKALGKQHMSLMASGFRPPRPAPQSARSPTGSGTSYDAKDATSA